MYMFSLILSHINYCLPTWSTANSTTLKPVMSLYKQALKILDKKPKSHHHCSVLHKYRLLSWDNLITFKNCCLMFKIRFNLAPPPLCSLVKFRTAATSATRGAARGDCDIPLKKVYLDSRFSQLGQPGNGTISLRTLENQPHSTVLKVISKHG